MHGHYTKYAEARVGIDALTHLQVKWPALLVFENKMRVKEARAALTMEREPKGREDSRRRAPHSPVGPPHAHTQCRPSPARGKVLAQPAPDTVLFKCMANLA